MNSKNPYSEIDFDSDYVYDSSAGGDITVEQFADNSELSVSSFITQIVDQSVATIGTLPQELALLTAILGVPVNAIGDQTTCVATAAQLQAALLNAASNGMIDVIKLVQGTYTGNFVYSNQTAADRYALTIQGGFTPGCTSRVLNPTNTVLDGNHSATPLVKEGRENVTVEGLTFRNGYSTTNGGGLSITGGGQAVIQHCRFETNTASISGGGAYIENGATLTDNVFTGNKANGSINSDNSNWRSVGGGGVFGGGTLTNNAFNNNTAVGSGGGAIGGYLTNNVFSGNTAGGVGGGALAGGGTNNVFNGNTASGSGGGLFAIGCDVGDGGGGGVA